MKNERLARLRLPTGEMIALDAESGEWVGDGLKAMKANEIANIHSARPNDGIPAVWAGKTVRDKLGGELQLYNVGAVPPADTIH